MSTPEGVIPYIDAHAGPKRMVTITLIPPGGLGAGAAATQVMPNVFVDGRQFIVYWGAVTVEVPADRAVHLAVGMQDGLRGASTLLPPGGANLPLEYRVSRMGSVYFGAPQPQ